MLRPGAVFALLGIVSRLNFSVIMTFNLGVGALGEFRAFLKRLDALFRLEDAQIENNVE